MIRIFHDGTEVNLNDYGLRCLSFEVESIGSKLEEEHIPGRDGVILIDGDLEPRNLKAKFMTAAADRNGYTLLQNQIYRLFDPRKEITIIDNKEPGKRWFVRSVAKFTPERINAINSLFELTLYSARPFAESVGSTLSPDESIQINTNYGDPPVQYVFNTSSFSVWNDGDSNINPRNNELIITFKGVSAGGLSIKNITTGDEWTYSNATLESDTIKLDGIRSTKNGLSIFRNSNKKLITLNTGWNDFQISGATDFTISFDFRYLYF